MEQAAKKIIHPYISRNPKICKGEPIISGTKTTVRAIVELWRTGVQPEEIPVHLPHISLAQIFDALGFYSENQDEINTYIEENHVPEDKIHPILKGQS
ncbi:MAG: DUF433 domain-containing protein [Candidatus Zhuqueibacterota bacterium]